MRCLSTAVGLPQLPQLHGRRVLLSCCHFLPMRVARAISPPGSLLACSCTIQHWNIGSPQHLPGGKRSLADPPLLPPQTSPQAVHRPRHPQLPPPPEWVHRGVCRMLGPAAHLQEPHGGGRLGEWEAMGDGGTAGRWCGEETQERKGSASDASMHAAKEEGKRGSVSRVPAACPPLHSQAQQLQHITACAGPCSCSGGSFDPALAPAAVLTLTHALAIHLRW